MIISFILIKVKFSISIIKKAVHSLFHGLFYIYKLAISPFIQHNSCRFIPSCSEYGLDAVKIHGVFKGGYLTVLRIFRCNPWGGSGYDPVPNKRNNSKKNKIKNLLV